MVDNLNQSRNSTRVKQAYFPKPSQRVGHFFQRATKRYPYFLQQTASDCGAACLVMVSRYWGKQFNINYLRDLCNVNRNGTNLRGIVVAAESVGFSTKMMRLSLNMLAKRQLPAIVHWQSGHYVVVYQVTRNKVIVGDPASGQCSLSGTFKDYPSEIAYNPLKSGN